MTMGSARAVAALALCGACLLPFQARPDDRLQTVVAAAPGHALLIPAMRADAFSRGRGILISGGGAEAVSLVSVPRQSVPKQGAAIEICVEP